MRVSRESLPAAALIAALALSACSGGQPAASPQAGAPDPARPLKLAFVTNNTSEFWKIAANGVHKYEAEGKVQVARAKGVDRRCRSGQPTLSGPVFGRGRAERHRWPAYQVRQEWQVRHQ